MTTRRITAVAGASAGGALLCAVCCVAPFALPAAMVAGIGGVLAWIGRMHAGMSILALCLVGLAWVWVISVGIRERRRPAASTLIALAAATFMLGLASLWPLFEPHVIAALMDRASAQQ
jgi:hypothetical protein